LWHCYSNVWVQLNTRGEHKKPANLFLKNDRLGKSGGKHQMKWEKPTQNDTETEAGTGLKLNEMEHFLAL
jgi:hypothetical protein